LNLPKLGEAKLKGISGHLLPADIVRIRVRPLTTGKGFINNTCAVIENVRTKNEIENSDLTRLSAE